MTAHSAAKRTTSDLRFLGIDPDGWVAFEAVSARDSAKTYTILFDRITKYAECSGTTKACREGYCWHRSVELLEQALVEETARQYVARAATLADVEAIGRQAKARIAACGEFFALVSPLDRAVLDAARAEFKARRRAERSALPAPVALPVARVLEMVA